jgi:hypothetical protein
MPHEILGLDISEMTDSVMFKSGTKVTNMKIIGSGNSCFHATNCTIFDYYYIFTRGQEMTSATTMFYGTKNEDYGKFN